MATTFQRTESNPLFGDKRVDQQIIVDRVVEWEHGWDCEQDRPNDEEPVQIPLLKDGWEIVQPS